MHSLRKVVSSPPNFIHTKEAWKRSSLNSRHRLHPWAHIQAWQRWPAGRHQLRLCQVERETRYEQRNRRNREPSWLPRCSHSSGGQLGYDGRAGLSKRPAATDRHGTLQVTQPRYGSCPGYHRSPGNNPGFSADHFAGSNLPRQFDNTAGGEQYFPVTTPARFAIYHSVRFIYIATWPGVDFHPRGSHG